MNSVNIGPDKRKAIVGPGARWGEFDKATQEHGLATTGGTVSTVGVAGYTLGGGTGYLARRFGLAADNLISAEVVTAGGELLRASDDENPDLFWALRGGGGNFGIVTSFEYRLYKVGPEVRAGQVVHAHEHAGKVLRFYRDFMKNASDQLTCYAFLLNMPPVDAFPEQYHGKPALSLVMAHSGPDESAVKELHPLLEFGDPILTAVQPMPYTATQQMFDAAMPKGNRWYSKAHYLDSLTDEAIKTILKFTESIPGPFSSAYLEPMGGAINRVSPEAIAFPHRHSDYGFHIFPGWDNPDSDKKLMSWGKDFFEAMTDHSNGGVYVNLMGQDEKERIDHAYGSNYSKLVQLKKKWDPANLFRSNHNIESM